MRPQVAWASKGAVGMGGALRKFDYANDPRSQYGVPTSEVGLTKQGETNRRCWRQYVQWSSKKMRSRLARHTRAPSYKARTRVISGVLIHAAKFKPTVRGGLLTGNGSRWSWGPAVRSAIQMRRKNIDILGSHLITWGGIQKGPTRCGRRGIFWGGEFWQFSKVPKIFVKMLKTATKCVFFTHLLRWGSFYLLWPFQPFFAENCVLLRTFAIFRHEKKLWKGFLRWGNGKGILFWGEEVWWTPPPLKWEPLYNQGSTGAQIGRCWYRKLRPETFLLTFWRHN